MVTQLPHKKGAQPPIFGLCLLWSNGSMDQDATWYGGRRRPRLHCVSWGPIFPPPTGAQPSPNFWPMSVVAKRSLISATAELLFALSSFSLFFEIMYQCGRLSWLPSAFDGTLKYLIVSYHIVFL